MPDIIANTSPLQYLHQLGLLHLLHKMYGRIVVPDAVSAELERGRSMGVELPKISSVSWIDIRSVRNRSLLPVVTGLGQGEKEVLTSDIESSNAVIVLDDLLARRHASLLGLKKTGILGILLKVFGEGLTDEELAFLLKLLEAFKKEDGICLGGETAHGFGRMQWELPEVSGVTNEDELREWLNGTATGFDGFPRKS